MREGCSREPQLQIDLFATHDVTYELGNGRVMATFYTNGHVVELSAKPKRESQLERVATISNIYETLQSS